MRKIFKYFPKQHGAWSIFSISIILGFLVADNFEIFPSLLFVISAFFAFLLRHNISILIRVRDKNIKKELLELSFIYFSVSFFSAFLVFIIFNRYLLLFFGLLATFVTLFTFYFVYKRKELSVPSELVGIFALTLLLPISYYVASGSLKKDIWFLFIFSYLFFSGSIFHVRYLVRNKDIVSKELYVRIKAGMGSLLYHTFVFLLVFVLSYKKILPSFYFIAILPALIKSYFFVFIRFRKAIPLKKIGFTELGVSIIFLFLSVVLWK